MNNENNIQSDTSLNNPNSINPVTPVPTPEAAPVMPVAPSPIEVGQPTIQPATPDVSVGVSAPVEPVMNVPVEPVIPSPTMTEMPVTPVMPMSPAPEVPVEQSNNTFGVPLNNENQGYTATPINQVVEPVMNPVGINTPVDNSGLNNTVTPVMIDNNSGNGTPVVEPIPNFNINAMTGTTPDINTMPEPNLNNGFETPMQTTFDSNPTPSPKKSKMPMILIGLFILALLIGGGIYVYLVYFQESSTALAANAQLLDIKESYEKTETFKMFNNEEFGTKLTISVNDNNINFSYTYTLEDEETQITCTSTLNENKLMTTINDVESSEGISCLFVTAGMYEAIGTMKGFEEGELSDIINSGLDQELMPFLEMKEDGSKLEYTFDITAEINLEELQELAEKNNLTLMPELDSDKIFTTSYIQKSDMNDEAYLLISDDSTIQIHMVSENLDNIYESILYTIETLYPDHYDSFKSSVLDTTTQSYENFHIYDDYADYASLTENGIDYEGKSVVLLYIEK